MHTDGHRDNMIRVLISAIGHGVKIKQLFQDLISAIYSPLWTLTKACSPLFRCTARWRLVVLLPLLDSTSFGEFQFLSTTYQCD